MASSLSRRGLFGLGFAAAIARVVPAPPLTTESLTFSPGAGTLAVGDVITFSGQSRHYIVQAVTRADIEFAMDYLERHPVRQHADA